MRRSLLAAVGTCVVGVAGLPVMTGSAASAAPTELFFSEYVEGSSNNKALEIFNGTGAPVDLAANGYNVQMFFNGSASAGLTVSLTGSVATGDVFVLAQGSAGPAILSEADQTSSASWFNGDDAVVLRRGMTVVDAIGQVGVDPGTEWGAGLTSTADNTLRRKSAVEAGDANTADAFDPAAQWDGFATDTFDGLGSRSGGTPPPPPHGVCGESATPISAIQGASSTNQRQGQALTVEAVVVGDYQGPGQFGGYYLQEEDSHVDDDAATSEGIFVFSATPVSIGELVRVSGTATEFSGLTQIANVSATTVCGAGPEIEPTPVTLPVPSVATWERYEGMSVTIGQPLTVTEVFTLSRFGEVALSAGGRLDNPTNVVEPGAPALALQDLNNRSRILLDDGNNQQNIDPTFYPQGGLSAANTLRVGDSVSSLSGVLDHRFSAYRVQPVDATAVSFSHTNPRPASPAPVGGSLRVGSFNVLNYFNGDGLGGGFPTPRGAENATELQRQQAKIVAAITALDADVLGLMELENDATGGGLSAVEDLVEALNEATAAGTYAFVDTGVVGTDQIRVGLLYQPGSVSPVGPHAVLDSSVDPRFVDTLNRPAVAQTFQQVDGDGRFTVVVNHLKSKGSDCNAVGDPDTGDGQGNCNLTRTRAAQALVDWLAGDPTGSGDADVLVVGDLNSYAKEDPIDVFRAAGYVDTINAFLGEHAYSYVFEGQSGYLDHALASPTLAAQVTGVTEWHVNADEPVALDYNLNFKSSGQQSSFYSPGPYRSSDHDPVLVGLDLAAFAFEGFYEPVDDLPTINQLRAGRAVPVSFSLGGDRGLDVLAAGSPKVRTVTCDSGAPVDPVESAETPGGSGLSYDAASGTYTYVWKSPKSGSGCRLLTLTFDDGTTRSALFELVR